MWFHYTVVEPNTQGVTFIIFWINRIFMIHFEEHEIDDNNRKSLS